MKKVLLVFLLMSFVLSAFALEKAPIERATADEFYLMPMSGEPAASDKWREEDYAWYCKDLYECGFNATGFIPIKYLKYAKENNLKCNIGCFDLRNDKEKDINKRAEDWAKKINDAIPAEYRDTVLRIYTQDEPFPKDLEADSAYAKAMAKYGLVSYINFNPNYSDILLGQPYDEYVDSFVKQCGLDYVIYDNYSWDVDEGFQEDRFYSNMEEIARIARNNNAKFFNIILASAHFNYAKPTDYSLNVQVWSTLAYGGRGIGYYKYIDPERTNYVGSAYDKYGRKTETWYITQGINYAIHNLNHVYKDLEWVNTFHWGNIPKGCQGPETAKLIKSFKPSCRGGENLVVGEFVGKKDGKYYALLVNKDPKHSVHVNGLEFNKGTKNMLILDYSFEERREMTFEWERTWIQPGHALLIRCD